MGCSHSDLIPLVLPSVNVATPSEFFDRHKDWKNSNMSRDQLDYIKMAWKLIGDEKEFFTLVMIRLAFIIVFLLNKRF